jgi:hypothetical protein
MAIKKFGVALWERLTFAKQHQDKASRLGLLEDALKAAYDLTYKHLPYMSDTRTIGWRPNSFDNIFVAPEYMFAKRVKAATQEWAYHHVRGQHPADVSSDERFMSEGQKDILLAELQTLSRKFRRTLLVPGTVAWQKPILRAKEKPGAKGRGVKAIERLKEGTRRQFRTVTIDGTEADNYSINDCGRQRQPDVRDEKGTLLLRPLSNVKKVKALRDATHVARNTAYVLLDGDIKLKYHKQGDFLEVLNSRGETVFVPGVSDGTFEVDGIDFGLEICLDHAAGFLSNLSNGSLPHIQIITADNVTLVPHHIHTKQNGYVLHADTWANRTELVDVGRWIVLDPVAEVVLEHDTLKVYVIELDV